MPNLVTYTKDWSRSVLHDSPFLISPMYVLCPRHTSDWTSKRLTKASAYIWFLLRLGVWLVFSGWDASPSQDTQHKVTRIITTPPEWDANLSQGTQHKVTRSITTTPEWDASPTHDTQHKVTITKEGVFFQNGCLRHTCVRNATCQAGFTEKQYRCICPAGFTGEQCQIGQYFMSSHMTMTIIIVTALIVKRGCGGWWLMVKTVSRTVPLVVAAHTFYASRDIQVSQGICPLIQQYFCTV